MITKINASFEKSEGKSQALAIFFHGYMRSAERLNAVCKVVKNKLSDTDLLRPQMPTGRLSMAQPNWIVQEVLKIIGEHWEKHKKENGIGYDRIYIIGHSLGSLLARKVYVCACGENEESPFEEEIKLTTKEPAEWAKKVDRVILLAGMNRGWSISHHLSIPNAILWTIGGILGNFLEVVRQKRPLIFTIRKGAPFITQLRIQWLIMRRKAEAQEKQVGQAMTIQILGSIDDMVSPEDNIDLIAGHDFIYLDAPYSNHTNIVEMDDSAPVPEELGDDKERQQIIRGKRREVFGWALTLSKDDLAKKAVIPSDLPLFKQRPEVTDVIFVIHGIRDEGYWTHKIARRVQMLAHEENKDKKEKDKRFFATETSSYGYFPMLSFLLSTTRRAKVEWFMDQYAESLALYPNARRFSFVGHSNGTYLLAKALKDYPCCKFENVVFAGSVVRTDYSWQTFLPSQNPQDHKGTIENGRIQAVLNYVATADWVVAFFPKVLEIFRRDLGSAGHDGFRFDGAEKQKEMQELVKYVKGFHSAALDERNWDAIAHFIFYGKPMEPPKSISAKKPSTFVRTVGAVAPIVWVIILFGLWWIGHEIWSLPFAEWARTTLLMLFFGVVWKVLTRV